MSIDVAVSATNCALADDTVLTSGERNMRQDLISRFSRAMLNSFVTALIVLAGTQAASATTKEEAAALCTQELTSDHGAQKIRDIEFHYHDHVPYVYGNADFSDAVGVHFRCHAYYEKVRTLRYLVKDPEYVDGRA